LILGNYKKDTCEASGIMIAPRIVDGD